MRHQFSQRRINWLLWHEEHSVKSGLVMLSFQKWGCEVYRSNQLCCSFWYKCSDCDCCAPHWLMLNGRIIYHTVQWSRFWVVLHDATQGSCLLHLDVAVQKWCLSCLKLTTVQQSGMKITGGHGGETLISALSRSHPLHILSCLDCLFLMGRIPN